MKRIIIAVVLALTLGLCAAALADPVITDGTVTAWIGDQNLLYLQTESGLVRRMSIPMEDLLSFTATDFTCVTGDHRVFSIRKDGLSSAVVLSNPKAEEVDALRDTSWSLQNGLLTVGDTLVSSAAVAAASNTRELFWVEQADSLFVLKRQPFPETAQAATGVDPLLLDGTAVPQPLSLMVSRDALTLTAADHSVAVFSLVTGERTDYPAVSDLTVAACAVNGQLNRYTAGTATPWQFEQSEPVALPAAPTAVPTVTPDSGMTPTQTPPVTPTPTVTPTPRPTATATVRPTPTPYTPDIPDGAIPRGDSGAEVRRIQQRLLDLGYPVGRVDGIYGSQTQVAINLFCDAIGVREHNYITRSVRNRLYASDAPSYDPYLPLKKGDRGLSVTYMQNQLAALGYHPGQIDGVYGSMTVSAVAAFQRDHDIKIGDHEVPGEYASRKFMKALYEPPAPVTTKPIDPDKPVKVTVGNGKYTLYPDTMTATLTGPAKNTITGLNIPPTITEGDRTFKVTKIEAGACSGLTSLEELSIGKNVKTIGANAFNGCENLRTITIKTTRLTDSSVGAGAFSGVYKKVIVSCPSDKLEDYKVLLRDKGMPKKADYT